MKQKIVLFALILMIVVLSGKVLAAQMVINVGHVEGNVGDIVEVQIDVRHLLNVSGGQFNVIYDPAIADITNIKRGALLSSRDESDEFLFIVISNRKAEPNKLSVAWVSGVSGGAEGLNVINNDGNLITLTFRLESAGKVNLGITGLKLFDDQGAEIPVANIVANSGSIAVQGTNVPGDHQEPKETGQGGTTTPGNSTTPSGTEQGGDGNPAPVDPANPRQGETTETSEPGQEGVVDNPPGDTVNGDTDKEGDPVNTSASGDWSLPVFMTILFAGVACGAIYYQKKIRPKNRY